MTEWKQKAAFLLVAAALIGGVIWYAIRDMHQFAEALGTAMAARQIESSGATIACGLGGTYFEHEMPDGGWEPIGWVNADGGHPYVSEAIQGYWYLPADAGHVRLHFQEHR